MVRPEPEVFFQDDAPFDGADDVRDPHALARNLAIIAFLCVVNRCPLAFLCGIVIVTPASAKPS
ncbi:MAG: hypothetical protein RMK84_04135 [Oscillochloridaceae bacterium]|nr:hypothetical protein [Chloroflexaceae bacterium]MDW8389294.1 hypothetical protein [Oscillochloridaceae bacterium]